MIKCFLLIWFHSFINVCVYVRIQRTCKLYMQGPAEKTSLELHKLKIWFGVGQNKQKCYICDLLLDISKFALLIS